MLLFQTSSHTPMRLIRRRPHWRSLHPKLTAGRSLLTSCCRQGWTVEFGSKNAQITVQVHVHLLTRQALQLVAAANQSLRCGSGVPLHFLQASRPTRAY